MKRKNIVIIVMLLSVFLIFTGCNEEGSSAGSTSQKAEMAADDSVMDGVEAADDVTIYADPPEGWEPVEGSVLPVQYMKGTASFMVKKEGFPGDSLDAVVAEAKSAFESTFDNVEYIGETESLNVAGTDARKLIFTCDVSGLKMKYEYVYLFEGNDVYAVTFGDLAENFDSLVDDYAVILSSISF